MDKVKLELERAVKMLVSAVEAVEHVHDDMAEAKAEDGVEVEEKEKIDMKTELGLLVEADGRLEGLFAEWINNVD